MEHKTVYVCTGGCKGVSPVAKNCGAATCPHFNEPLEPRVQCDACAAAAEMEGDQSLIDNAADGAYAAEQPAVEVMRAAETIVPGFKLDYARVHAILRYFEKYPDAQRGFAKLPSK